MRQLLLCALIAIVAMTGHPRAQNPAAAFHVVGDLPGGGFTTVIRDATKANGVIYAVGGAVARRATCGPPGLCIPDTAVLWQSDAPNALQALPDYVANASTSQVQAFAITPDAAYIASQARDLAGATLVNRATRVTRSALPSATANLNFGAAPYAAATPPSAAFAISTTGSVLYGTRSITGVVGSARAVRFNTVAGTATDVPLPAGVNVNAFNTVAGARATSNDGRIAVGWTFTGATDHRAFTYNNTLGTSLQIPLLPGGTTNDALAVGPNGGIVLATGNSTEYPNGEAYFNIYDSNSNTNAIVERLGSPNTLWSPGGRMCVDLDNQTACQPTPFLSAGLAIPSSTTRIVVMNFSGSDGQGAYVHNPFGWFHLSSVLAANGVDLEGSGWSHVVVTGISRDATLVYGFGSLNGSITGWVAEFGSGVLGSFNPAAAPPADTSIVGGWLCNNPNAPPTCVLIFTADGAYYHIQQASPGDLGSGFERGYYTFDGSHLSFTTLLDTNGSIGASGVNGSPRPATISGDTLMLGDEPVGLRIPGAAGTLNGAWVQGAPTQPDSSIAIVFTSSGKYFMAWDDQNLGTNVDGIEIGQFTWNPTTGTLVPDISQGVHTGPTPGDGLSDFAAGGSLTVMLTPDGLGLDTGGDPTQPRRVIDPATIPAITNSQLSANGTVGEAFGYNVTATNAAVFGASGLPDGLAIDPVSGAIAGTPNVGGQFAVTMSAMNAAGVSDFETLVVTIAIPTPVGTNVIVQPEVPAGQGPVTMTFADVTSAGTTTVTTVDLDQSGIPPPGNVDVGGVIYEVQTTAQYTGLIQLCFSYAGIDFGSATPRLFHYENDQWVDITTSVDTNTQTICGATTSLSPFAVLVSHVVRTGFYAPVNPIAGFLNTVKGGSTVPLKFNVTIDGIEKKTTDGLIFTVQTIACDSSAPLDPVDFTVAGETTLRYDAAAGQFIQNWKVPKTPGCYLVRMTTEDALALTARFKVR